MERGGVELHNAVAAGGTRAAAVHGGTGERNGGELSELGGHALRAEVDACGGSGEPAEGHRGEGSPGPGDHDPGEGRPVGGAAEANPEGVGRDVAGTSRGRRGFVVNETVLKEGERNWVSSCCSARTCRWTRRRCSRSTSSGTVLRRWSRR